MRASVALLLGIAITGVAAASASDAVKGMSVVDEFVWAAVKPFYRRPIDEVRHFATLAREAKNTNQDGSTSYTFSFRGVVVSGIVPPGKEFLVQRLVVTAPHFPVPQNLGVGARVSKVLTVLGKPNERTATFLRFEGETERAVFHLANGRVAKVEFLVYSD